MNEILAKIQQKLGLRRLAVSKTQKKKNKTIEQFVIGYVHQDIREKIKINFLSNPIPSGLKEDEIEGFVEKELTSFKTEFGPVLEKILVLLTELQDSKQKEALQYFKGLFLGALANFSDKELKTTHVNQVFKKQQKKQKNQAKIQEAETQIQKLLQSLKIQEYHSYFGTARAFKRTLKLYVGPTNSGKTYHALNDLAAHERGVYLSPLRLLAWEGKEELEKRGRKTSLITGEERREEEGATFRAQTIETLNFHEVVDAVLIDEIQMLFDKHRGWAWTQALVGAPCKELIMAGSPEAEPLVRKIADLLGEKLEVIRLNRFNPLEVKSKPFEIDQIQKLPEGSAIIAFSRKNVLDFKKAFEKHNIPVSVIYGNLSPEVRKEEAKKFRDGQNKYLIATDAISMGLNLPISTIIFSTVEKFNGQYMDYLEPMEIKQIAGRAGRYGKVEKGEVGAFYQDDLKFIKTMISAEGKVNNHLFIKPSWDHILRISEELNTQKLFPIFSFFTNNLMKSAQGLYVCSSLEEQKTLSFKLDEIQSLTLEDKFLFVNAPVPGEDHYAIYMRWIKMYLQGREIPLPPLNILNPKDFYGDRQLILETYVKLLNLYSWLCFKKKANFTGLEECMYQKENCNKEIEALLSSKK